MPHRSDLQGTPGTPRPLHLPTRHRRSRSRAAHGTPPAMPRPRGGLPPPTSKGGGVASRRRRSRPSHWRRRGAWPGGAWRRRKKTPLGAAGPLAAGRCLWLCLSVVPAAPPPACSLRSSSLRAAAPRGRRVGRWMWDGPGGRRDADGGGDRRGGRWSQLLLQGGASRGGLRGENLPGAALLREQVQRQAHHYAAGAGRAGGSAGLGGRGRGRRGCPSPEGRCWGLLLSFFSSAVAEGGASGSRFPSGGSRLSVLVHMFLRVLGCGSAALK